MAAIALADGALLTFLRQSNLGIRIRAGILDLETVSTLGVNIYMLRSVNFAIGTLLAGFAGVLSAGVLQLAPTMGNDVIMATFVAVVVGGLGSLLGSVLGALLIGLAAGATSAYYPAASDAVIYAIMAVVLIVRPRGLLGQVGLLESAGAFPSTPRSGSSSWPCHDGFRLSAATPPWGRAC